MSNATTLWYENPARNFNEALPLGNGRMGAMFYGSVEKEKISLNEDTLWTGWPRQSKMQCAHVYERIQQLVLEGKNTEAMALFENEFGDFLVQQYLPLGDLILEFPHEEKITGYRRELSLSQAVGAVCYTAGGCHYRREYVMSPGYNVLAVNLSCGQGGKVIFRLSLAGKLQCRAYAQENTLFLAGNCPIALAEYGDLYRDVDHHHYGKRDEEKGVGYLAGVTVTAENGTVREENGGLLVENAHSATLYFAVRTSFNGPDKHPVLEGKPYEDACRKDLQEAVNAGFDAIRADAVSRHSEMFARTNLVLPDGTNSALPTDVRLTRHQEEEDPSLYALLFNFGKYLTISASQKGTRAMNLQGIWNEKILPPWSSNYTLNINTEMNYWPTLQLGLSECYEPLVSFIKGLHENGQKTAQNFYGKQGFVSHHASDVWCLTHPSTSRLPGSTQWGFWNMSSGWLCRMLFDYYEYTGDTGYLQSIWPILSDSAAFYRQMLTEQDGELILCPSTSPENNYLEGETKSAVDKTTAMTMQIIRDVFSCCIKAGEILHCDAEVYKSLLPRLKGNSVDSDGTLNEWYEPHEQWEVHHRHLSHLYGLFPAKQFDDAEKEAAKKVLIQRGDGGTGWSLAWKINLWARLKDGEKAKQLLDTQLRMISSEIDDASVPGGSYPNLFCAHPPFQIDGNFGACSGIIQMLLQTDEQGNPIILPALPKSWHTGAVERFRLPGNRAVSFRWENGKVRKDSIQIEFLANPQR